MTLAVALVLALAVALPGPSGAAAFSTADAPRSASVPVADDGSALLGLDVAGTVATNATDRLVTVTNRLGASVTVRVSLRPDSTDLGDLVVDGQSVGDAATLSLAGGGRRTVSVAVVNDTAAAGRTLAFDVSADGPAVAADASNRTAAVVEQ